MNMIKTLSLVMLYSHPYTVHTQA